MSLLTFRQRLTQVAPSVSSSGAGSQSGEGAEDDLEPPSTPSRRPGSVLSSAHPQSTTSNNRRQRNENSDEDEVQSEGRRTDAKRMKSFADEAAARYDISRPKVDKFLKFTISEMLIDLKCQLTMVADYQEESMAGQLHSMDFQATYQEQLHVCLLSPNLTAYVRDTINRVTDFVKYNCGLFGLNKRIFVKNMKAIRKITSQCLARIRSTLKTKLVQSLEGAVTKGTKPRAKGLNILELAKAVAPTSMEISSHHHLRIAFLRQCVRAFQALQDSKKTAAPESSKTVNDSESPNTTGGAGELLTFRGCHPHDSALGQGYLSPKRKEMKHPTQKGKEPCGQARTRAAGMCAARSTE
ncbi:hypothetical protein BDW22DRAFT_1426917 [Trametopsis cervina]|nr:hypothetical protein BDW22DRAFT_1426917 [Trametopsis cervina]